MKNKIQTSALLSFLASLTSTGREISCDAVADDLTSDYVARPV